MNKSPLTMEAIQAMHDAGQLAEAEAACVEWLLTHPDDVVVMHRLALLYAQTDRLDEAQAQLEKGLAIAPDDSSLLLRLANILKAKGSLDQAEKVLQTLIQAHPEFAPAYNNLG